MANRSIALPNGTLSYLIAGHGPEKVMLWHGAGQHKEVFPLVNDPAIHTQFTFYSFDLFYHGDSVWHDPEQPIELKDLKVFIEKFFEAENIDSCSIMAFSLGSRFALATMFLFPTKTKRLILLAPDGLRFHFVYQLAVGNVFMRTIFRWLLNSPQVWRILNDWAHRIGLTNKTAHRLLEGQMSTPDKRDRIYSSWIAFRKLKFDKDVLVGMIASNTIALFILIAKQDTFINQKAVKEFCIRANGRFEELDTHHNGLLRHGKSILLTLTQ